MFTMGHQLMYFKNPVVSWVQGIMSIAYCVQTLLLIGFENKYGKENPKSIQFLRYKWEWSWHLYSANKLAWFKMIGSTNPDVPDFDWDKATKMFFMRRSTLTIGVSSKCIFINTYVIFAFTVGLWCSIEFNWARLNYSKLSSTGNV